MSTQSIMKNIVINEQKAAEIFINALEEAAQSAETSIPYHIDSEDLSKNDLKKYQEAIKK